MTKYVYVVACGCVPPMYEGHDSLVLSSDDAKQFASRQRAEKFRSKVRCGGDKPWRPVRIKKVTQ